MVTSARPSTDACAKDQPVVRVQHGARELLRKEDVAVIDREPFESVHRDLLRQAIPRRLSERHLALPLEGADFPGAGDADVDVLLRQFDPVHDRHGRGDRRPRATRAARCVSSSSALMDRALRCSGVGAGRAVPRRACGGRRRGPSRKSSAGLSAHGRGEGTGPPRLGSRPDSHQQRHRESGRAVIVMVSPRSTMRMSSREVGLRLVRAVDGHRCELMPLHAPCRGAVPGDERFSEHFCAVAAAPWRALQICKRAAGGALKKVRAGECAPRAPIAARMPAGLATGMSAGMSAGTVARVPPDPLAKTASAKSDLAKQRRERGRCWKQAWAGAGQARG